MEQSNRKMEAAQKSGDPGAQTAAAMEQLGTLMGGGRRVNPVDIDQLKPFIPQTFAGLPKVSSNAEKSGVAGLMVSKAAATYGDRAKRACRSTCPTPAGRGCARARRPGGHPGRAEDDNGFERTQR